MTNVEIYTTRTCPYCNKAKRILKSQGLDYNEHVYRFNTPEMDALIEKTGWFTVPQIFINETFIGGCDDLQDLVRKDKLKELL